MGLAISKVGSGDSDQSAAGCVCSEHAAFLGRTLYQSGRYPICLGPSVECVVMG